MAAKEKRFWLLSGAKGTKLLLEREYEDVNEAIGEAEEEVDEQGDFEEGKFFVVVEALFRIYPSTPGRTVSLRTGKVTKIL